MPIKEIPMSELDFHTKAKELLELKRQIKSLLIQEQLLKEELLPFLKEQKRINFDFGYIYYGESKGAETFSRKDVLHYLREAYGDALADQVDEDCTKKGEPKKIVYVKLNDS